MTPNNAAIVPVAAAPEARLLFVIFKVDDADYALSSDEVLQMESFSGATAVPGSEPFVAGIIQLRGRVVPVVDLRARFGLPPRATTLETRVVVGQHGERTVALVADSVREVLRIAPSEIKAPPRLVDVGGQGFVKGIAQLGPRTILVLDFAKVIGEEPIDV